MNPARPRRNSFAPTPLASGGGDDCRAFSICGFCEICGYISRSLDTLVAKNYARRMRMIPTDMLTDLCGLSLGLILLLLPVGFVLWLFGWWSHRFWIVLLTTVLAGIFGLHEATSWRAQPVVA